MYTSNSVPQAEVNVKVDALESDKIMKRVHGINENLASILGQLVQFTNRLTGPYPSAAAETSVCDAKCPPAFLDQIHHTMDDSYNYIASIREALARLERF